MKPIDFLLIKTMEEASEVSQHAASLIQLGAKALRFGVDSRPPSHSSAFAGLSRSSLAGQTAGLVGNLTAMVLHYDELKSELLDLEVMFYLISRTEAAKSWGESEWAIMDRITLGWDTILRAMVKDRLKKFQKFLYHSYTEHQIEAEAYRSLDALVKAAMEGLPSPC